MFYLYCTCSIYYSHTRGSFRGGVPEFPEIPFGVDLATQYRRLIRDTVAIQSAYFDIDFLSRSTYRIADGYMNYTIILSLFQISNLCTKLAYPKEISTS